MPNTFNLHHYITEEEVGDDERSEWQEVDGEAGPDIACYMRCGATPRWSGAYPLRFSFVW